MNSLADRIRALPRYAFRTGTTCDEDCHADMYPAAGLTAEWVRVADLEVVLSSDNPDSNEELEATRKRIAELERDLALWQTLHGGGAEVIPSFTITSDNADEPEWTIQPAAKEEKGE